MTSKVWLITGTSKGFGRIWAEAALARGDRVAATARDLATLQPLVQRYGDRVLAITLDVDDKTAVDAAVAQTIARFERIDVAVNNAGYGLFGAIEEVSEAEARAQMETNFFGALWVTQAVLPQMRAQGSGHIIQVSSIGGVNAFPTIGLYHASKWALEGFSQSLAIEVAPFGIKVTLVEPAGYATDWSGPSAKANSRPMASLRGGARRPRDSAAPRGHAWRPQGQRARDPEDRRCPGAAVAHLLRNRRPSHDPRRIHPADRDLGGLERGLRRGAGRLGRQTGALIGAALLRRQLPEAGVQQDAGCPAPYSGV